MSGTGSLVSVEGVGKRYRNGVWGVRDATFRLPAGRVTGLVGPNGAGKSTTLNLLGGLTRPTQGTVEMVSANGRVGWCPQVDLIDWSLTVAENVLLGGRLLGLGREEARSSTAAVLGVTGLSACAERNAETLSGGQLRRMQIARALIGDPAVLILDEPASGLDPEGTDVLFGELRARARHGAVVLVSSHDLHSVESFADDILLLEAGTVVAHSPVQEFLARGEEVVGVEVDLDAPPDEALRALLAGQLVELSIDGSHVAGRLKPGTTTAGFLRMVLSAAEVADFKQRTASLRDVYLARSPGAGPSGREAS